MHHLHEMLVHTCDTHGSRHALVMPDGTACDYDTLLAHAGRLAGLLSRGGVERGDRVGFYLTKTLLAALTPYATSLLGCAFVPINPALKAAQVEHLLRDSGMTALITTPERALGLADALRRATALRLVVLDEAPREAAPPGVEQVVWDANAAVEVKPHPGGDDDELAALLYTSGSTGAPKGVMIAHRNLVRGCHSVAEYLHLSCDDVLLAALPFSFDYGLNQWLSAVSVGAQCVLHDYYFPRALLDAVKRHGVTGLAGVPTMWNHVARAGRDIEPCAGLRYFTNSGGALPRDVLRRLRRVFPAAAPYLMYGLTEAFRSTYLEPALVDVRPGSIGKAVPGADIVVIREDGSTAVPGEEGELVHCGDLVSKGYWNAPEATRARFRKLPGREQDAHAPLCVYSGDIVRLDEDGFLYFVGRRDGLIKTSGYRLSPEEIEQVFYELPEVREACAFGVPDATLGQRVILAVVVEDEAGKAKDAIDLHCRRELPSYMVPAEIHCVETLPKNANGKFDRPALAASYAAGEIDTCRAGAPE